MLNRPYEQNADELMTMIQQHRFDEVEHFLGHVIKHRTATRDGIQYFRAVLEKWFFASEVLEFSRLHPVPQEILPHLNAWIDENPESDIAHIVRGVFYIERAWEIRKRGFSNTVKRDQKAAYLSHIKLARGDLDKAYALNPANPHSSRQLIRVQRSLDAKDRVATDTYFQRATQDNPVFYWAYRAKLENMMPKWGGTGEEMMAFATETLKNAPRKSLLPHVYAHAIEEVGHRSGNRKKFFNEPKVWSLLEKIYLEILKNYPDSSMWRVKFAQLAMYADKESVVRQYLDEAQKLDPKDPRMLEYKARLAEEHGQWQKEIEYANRIIALCPQYPGGYAMVGYARLSQKRYKEAVQSLSAAIDLNPGNPVFWANRCSSYNQLSEYDLAVSDCSEAIQINDRYKYAYQQRAHANKRLGNTEAANADQLALDRLTDQ